MTAKLMLGMSLRPPLQTVLPSFSEEISDVKHDQLYHLAYTEYVSYDKE